jgi:prevent-host-death family protein
MALRRKAHLEDVMKSIGVRELNRDAHRIVRRVRENGESFTITYRGRPFARLIPATQPEVEDVPEGIREASTDGCSAVDAVRETKE